MRNRLSAYCLFCLYFVLSVEPVLASDPPIAIALHGGAGTIQRDKMTQALETQYLTALETALDTGYKQLVEGKDGLDAVVAAVMILENSPLFNAGVGAVYTFDGHHELDASIMHGANREAGAVAGIKTIKNPIVAARLVLDKSVHVLLSGEGAETFAHSHGIEKIDNDIFNTERRLEALQRAKLQINNNALLSNDNLGVDYRFGTVGVVVLDKKGNIVAGTSTGGMTAKRFGRIGDSPIIGAGTFADNASCGVSATGHGEFFIRYNVAADICARMSYQNKTLKQAANEVINDVLKKAGGDGGVVAVDSLGNVAMPFNTSGMYRASIDHTGKRTVAIYR